MGYVTRVFSWPELTATLTAEQWGRRTVRVYGENLTSMAELAAGNVEVYVNDQADDYDAVDDQGHQQETLNALDNNLRKTYPDFCTGPGGTTVRMRWQPDYIEFVMPELRVNRPVNPLPLLPGTYGVQIKSLDEKRSVFAPFVIPVLSD